MFSHSCFFIFNVSLPCLRLFFFFGSVKLKRLPANVGPMRVLYFLFE